MQVGRIFTSRITKAQGGEDGYRLDDGRTYQMTENEDGGGSFWSGR